MPYLDHNATTPLDPRVLERMLPYFIEQAGNASSRDHRWGWDAAEAVELARQQVADLIGASPAEIIFTGTATESVHLAIRGAFIARARNSKCVVTSRVEHEAVLSACEQLHRDHQAEIIRLGVDRDGAIDVTAWSTVIESQQPALVALMLANNEIGTIYPMSEVAQRAQQCGVVTFSDLTQAAGKIPIDVRAWGLDLAAFSPHKFGGPKGVGALYVRGGPTATHMRPLIPGSHEHGLRGGTLNVPGIVGFGAACEFAGVEMSSEQSRLTAMRDRFESALLADLLDLWINGQRNPRLANTTSIGFGGLDARALIRAIDKVACSTRSACSSDAAGPSHVLLALGLSEDQAYQCIRFSLGKTTTDEELVVAQRLIVQAARQLRGTACNHEQGVVA